MENKRRKLPARASARVEAGSGKSTPTPPPKVQTRPPSPAAVEQPLPKSLIPGTPLPTVESPQPGYLSSNEYQSIQESRVLAESLERSRRKWMSEGIFERFWVKPTKKRKGDNTPQEFTNPPRESMAKLGPCTITIEPHVFDAVMYQVKDMTPKPPQPAQPQYRPIIQYGPPAGAHHPPPPSPVPQPLYSTPHTPMQGGQAQAQQRLPQNTPGRPPQSPAPNNHTPITNGHRPATSNAQTPSQPQQSPAPPAKSNDPVIQMLAERASTDQDLKALMRIVADGKATTEELRKFQSHIEDISKILQARQAAAARLAASATASSPQAQAGHPPQPTQQAPQSRPANLPQQAPSPYYQNTHSPAQHNAPKYQPPPPQPPAPVRAKAPPAPKPDIAAVVFEFVGGNGDRYKFPEYSILEYMPNGGVIASFLIIRKGSKDNEAYDPTIDYYQPVTIRIWSTVPGKQLDALAKVVKPPDEVRLYMDDIMSRMTRAEFVILAMRLPREQALANTVMQSKEREKDGVEAMEGVLWSASAELLARKEKREPVKVVSEEQQYLEFIKTVS